MTEIKTERLLLRPWAEADLPRLAELANRPEIAYMMATIPHPYTLVDAQEFYERMQTLPENAAQFCIALTTDPNQMIGGCGYGPARGEGKPYGEIDFGYWLGCDYWGKGYASEAAIAVVNHAFAVNDIARIDTDYLLSNPASGKILQKLGFEEVDTRTCHSCGSGKADPSMHVRLTKQTWQSHQEARP